MPSRPPVHQGKRPAPQPRLSAARMGYDRQWRALRLRVLREEPLCRQCQRAASQVDHILPLTKGGSNDRDNLQSLCASCHSTKTGTERGRAT